VNAPAHVSAPAQTSEGTASFLAKSNVKNLCKSLLSLWAFCNLERSSSMAVIS